MPEPWPVNLPRPCSARLKMVGNMIELHRPNATIAHFATDPSPKVAVSTSTMEPRSVTASDLPDQGRPGG